MRPATVKTALETHAARFDGEAAVSGWSYPGLDAEQAANMMPTMHRHYRSTTAARLRAAGFEVASTGREGHVTIKFSGSGTDEEIDELLACFEPEQVRPQYS